MKAYIVGSNPCKIKSVFLDRKKAKEECDKLNSSARRNGRYYYEIKSVDLLGVQDEAK